jgi:hypothetical protein
MAQWPLTGRRELKLRQPVTVAGFRVEAWPVEHSLKAPAVGFKVSARGAHVFYVPDVAALGNPRQALKGVELYIGDGAAPGRPIVRQRGPVRIGHATIATQLEWCRRGGVRRAVFTHCGSAIVRTSTRSADALVRSLGRDRGVDARVAHDGARIRVRANRHSQEKSHAI